LFNALPRRCVVLLEDIDTAGLKRDEEAHDEDPEPAENHSLEDPTGLQRMENRDGPRRPKKQGIALSGLLNAIDGVASHEGRLLIMTTNLKTKLDPALIRPGRVDMQIEFSLATNEQIRELFVRMFTDDNDRKSPTKLAGKEVTMPLLANGGVEKKTESTKPQSDLRELAQQFADLIPDNTFSPAEIQGFLLKRKDQPLRALDEVASWRDHLLSSKSKKKHTKTVSLS
jgi:chaperone BCS1